MKKNQDKWSVQIWYVVLDECMAMLLVTRRESGHWHSFDKFFLLLDSGSSRGPGDIRPWSSWTSWDQVEPPGQADQQDRVPQTLSAGVLQHIQGRLDCKCWYLFIQMTQRKKKQIHARKWRFDSSKSLYCIVNSMSVAPHFLFWLSLWNLLLEQPW